MNNIAEGFERGSKKDFVRFLYYSKGSIGELRRLLRIGYELEYFEKNEYDTFVNEEIKLSKHLSEKK